VSEQDKTPETQPDLTTPEGRAQHNVNMILTNPSSVPEKFRKEDGSVNVDEILASYSELERRQGSGSSAEPPPTAETAKEESTASVQQADKTIAEELADPPASSNDELWAKAQKELASGGVTSETRQALIAAGVPEAVLEATAAAFKAKAAETRRAMAEKVGGEETLKRMLDWAKKLPGEERQSLIAALGSPGWETALLGLKARATAAGRLGEQGQLVDPTGDGVPPSAASDMRAWANPREMQAAMRDPRYGTDPAYTAMVETRCIFSTGDHEAAKRRLQQR
jgi:hypothetical protein